MSIEVNGTLTGHGSLKRCFRHFGAILAVLALTGTASAAKSDDETWGFQYDTAMGRYTASVGKHLPGPVYMGLVMECDGVLNLMTADYDNWEMTKQYFGGHIIVVTKGIRSKPIHFSGYDSDGVLNNTEIRALMRADEIRVEGVPRPYSFSAEGSSKAIAALQKACR